MDTMVTADGSLCYCRLYLVVIANVEWVYSQKWGGLMFLPFFLPSFLPSFFRPFFLFTVMDGLSYPFR
ncbi:unnamed protein product, partial [Ectocarpus sp. 8 AP-2014]